MKRFIYIIIVLFIISISSCVDLNNQRTLPDLTGKNRAEIEEIMEELDIEYVFKFSSILEDNSFGVVGLFTVVSIEAAEELFLL